MNNFLRGLLIGVGVGMLIAPMKGEDMRRMISQRANELRGYLPENEQLNVYRQQISDRVSQTAGTLKDYAQQAASTMKSTASDLGNIAQQATSTVKQAGSDVASTTKDAVNSVKSASSTTPSNI